VPDHYQLCKPKSPWRRAINESTSELLCPEKSESSICNQWQLDAIAKSTQHQASEHLGFMTPCEAFAEAVAAVA
jgi:IS30 family transposase